MQYHVVDLPSYEVSACMYRAITIGRPDAGMEGLLGSIQRISRARGIITFPGITLSNAIIVSENDENGRRCGAESSPAVACRA